MRKLSRIALCIVSLFLAIGCTKNKEYTNVIPSDASFVTSINLKSLIDKSGIANKENNEIKQKMMDALKNELSASTYQQIAKIIQSPNESGINISSPIYLFTSPTFTSPMLVAKISDEDALKNSLKMLEQEQMAQPVKEAKGYNYTTINGRFLAYNHSAIILSFAKNDQSQDIAALFEQPIESSAVQTKIYQKAMQAGKEDIKCYANMAALPSEYTKQMHLTLPPNVQLKDVLAIVTLNFENGKIVLTTENYTENEELKTFYKKEQAIVMTTSGAFDKYFPANSLFYVTAAFQGEKILQLFQEISKNDAELQNLLKSIQNATAKEIVNEIDGDVAVGITNIQNNLPTFIAYAKVKSATALDNFYKKSQNLNLGQGRILKLSENEYVYKMSVLNVDVFSIYFGVKDNIMYATNNEDVYKKFPLEEKDNIQNAPYGSDMRNTNAFIAINIEAILAQPIVANALNNSGPQAALYKQLASELSYLSIGSSADGKGIINLSLKDKQTNALQQIIDTIRQLFLGKL